MAFQEFPRKNVPQAFKRGVVYNRPPLLKVDKLHVHCTESVGCTIRHSS